MSITSNKILLSPKSSLGFTLIELSIVLVIIGLIVGGVMVGQTLIGSAGIRATISQVEKFNTAVNNFRGKYRIAAMCLPGSVSTFGSGIQWAAYGYQYGNNPPGTTSGPEDTTCFDNGNVAGAISQYSVGYKNGSMVVCALSFCVPVTISPPKSQ